MTVLPSALVGPLGDHLREVKRTHSDYVAAGWGRVLLPDALERKCPNAAAEWRWHWVFPQERRGKDRKTGREGRHHVHESPPSRAEVLPRENRRFSGDPHVVFGGCIDRQMAGDGGFRQTAEVLLGDQAQT